MTTSSRTWVRSLDPGMDPTVVDLIDGRLAAVAREHGVAIPWAIESGSRAWGFPSPDSDYDCRFIFVRPMSTYLDPWPARDVIETPLDNLLDVGGWDLIKAIRLAENGNATVAEWLRSPVVYGGDTAFRDELLRVWDAVGDLARVGRHYLHVGRDHWERSGAGDGLEVHLKRVFYAIRPAAAIHWMLQLGGLTPPMNLLQLMAEAPPPTDVVDSVSALIEAKSRTREMGSGRVDKPVRDWVIRQFEEADQAFVTSAGGRREGRAEAAEAFRALVRAWQPVEQALS